MKTENKECVNSGEINSDKRKSKYVKLTAEQWAIKRMNNKPKFNRLTPEQWAIKKANNKYNRTKLTADEWKVRKEQTRLNRIEKRKTEIREKSERMFKEAIGDFQGEYKVIPENHNYIALTDGRVWSNISNKFLATANHVLGYLFIGRFIINGQRKLRLLHTVIAHTFLDNPNGYTEINHKDGNKKNCVVDNLEFCTRRENMVHSWKNGFMENSRTMRSTPVLQFASDGTLIAEYASTIQAAVKLGLTRETVSNYCYGKTKKPKYILRHKTIDA